MTDSESQPSRFELQLVALMPRLQVWAYRRTGDSEAANDLLQDTLVRALQARSSFAEDSNLGAWLFMIMKNLAADEARKRLRRGPHLAIDQIASALGVAPRQDVEIALRDLWSALAQLSDDQQDLLLRVAVGSESYHDLASDYGVAIGTVKSRVARARADLRGHLEAPADGSTTAPQLCERSSSTYRASARPLSRRPRSSEP